MVRNARQQTLRLAISAAALLALGIVLSGPVAMIILALTRPQPAWTSAQTFAANYHPIQALPYFFGFLLLAGSVVLICAIYRLAREEDRPVMLPALIFVGVYASLVSLNYVIQTTFVPALVKDAAQHRALISALAMANPSSLAWALEMYAYGFLGVATMFVAPYFKGDGLERVVWWLLIANGVLSIIAALITSFELSWVFSGAGMASFFIWNALMLVLVCLMIVVFRRQGARS